MMSICQQLNVSSVLSHADFQFRLRVETVGKKKGPCERKKWRKEEIMLRTVESIIAQSSVNLYFMTAFHPSSKQQVDEQTLHMLKTTQPPSSP